MAKKRRMRVWTAVHDERLVILPLPMSDASIYVATFTRKDARECLSFFKGRIIRATLEWEDG